MNKKLKNLIIELNTMIDSGSIKVGALGLSQDSVDYVRELGEETTDEEDIDFLSDIIGTNSQDKDKIKSILRKLWKK